MKKPIPKRLRGVAVIRIDDKPLEIRGTITVGDRFVRVRQSSLGEWIRRREAGGKVRDGR